MPKGESKKAGKKRATTEEEEDQDPGVGDLPVADEEAASQAASRKQKKQKKQSAPEPNPEPEAADEPVDDDDVVQDDGNEEEKNRKKLRRQRENKKISGYRAKATECGFEKGAGVIAASGVDSFASALTVTDAKRLMRFVPEVLNKSSYDKTECAARMKLSTESVPVSAARVTQARCEAVARNRMNEAVLRTVEKGVMRIDAATMQAVLRPYQYNMTFTAVLPPKGLVRYAQGEGVLSANAFDEAAVDQEKIDNRELIAAAKKIESDDAKRKEAYKAKRVAAKAQTESATAA